MEILAIGSTNRHVTEAKYILDEWVEYNDVSLKLALTAPATLRISVHSKQNDTLTVVKDIWYTNYPQGETIIPIGKVTGKIGVKFDFKEYLTFVNPNAGYTSSYDNNKSYASVSVVYSNTSAFGESTLKGTLLEVANKQPTNNTKAEISDIPAVNIEFKNGAWFGNFGIHETKNTIPTTNIGAGSTATIAGVQSTYRGPGVGWVAIGGDVADVAAIYTRSAAANLLAGNGDLRILCNGDSISAGINMTMANHYSTRAAQAIARTLGVESGLGWTWLYYYAPYSPTQVGVTITKGVGWTFSNYANPFMGTLSINAPVGTATSLDVTFDEQVDSISVLWANGSGYGPLIYSWNDGETTTITGVTTGNLAYKVTSIPAPSLGNHKLQLWQPATGNRATYIAAEPQNSTKRKVRASTVGTGSKCISDMFAYFNKASGAGAENAISAMLVDLFVIEIGTNDRLQQTGWSTPDSFETKLNAMINLVKSAGSTKAQCAVVGAYESSTSGYSYTPADYSVKAEKACINTKSIFIDMLSRWVDYPATLANGLVYDGLHPSEKGGVDMGCAISASLGLA